MLQQNVIHLTKLYRGIKGSATFVQYLWLNIFIYLNKPINKCLSIYIYTTDETSLVEMRIWCIKIGIVFTLHFNPWVEASAGGLLVPEGLYSTSQLLSAWVPERILSHWAFEKSTSKALICRLRLCLSTSQMRIGVHHINKLRSGISL